MLGALGAARFSPLVVRVFWGNAVSPIPAAPLCWVFCLSPREPVGPAELCVQGLGRSCSQPVVVSVVTCTLPGRLLADLLLWACAWGN